MCNQTNKRFNTLLALSKESTAVSESDPPVVPLDSRFSDVIDVDSGHQPTETSLTPELADLDVFKLGGIYTVLSSNVMQHKKCKVTTYSKHYIT